jgi:uncharacterized membrane protein YfcA
VDVPVTPGGLVLVGLAGLAGGAINAAAGGGTLVTFPALLHAGLSPLAANVTNTVGLVPGYLGGVAGHRRWEPLPEVSHRALLGASGAGAAVGVALLLLTPQRLFSHVAPYLVLVAVVLLLAQRRILAALRRRGHAGSHRGVMIAVTVAAVYGAYFGAALGVMLVALLSITSRAEFPLANAVKTLLSFLINLIAGLAYAVLAPVAWLPALVVAVTSTAGGYVGGSVARRIPVVVLRLVTAALGLVAAATLFAR